MKRIVAASAIAAAFAAPAHAGTFADVLTQLVQPLTVKPQSGGIPHIGDENDLSWVYAPNEKPVFQGKVASEQPRARIGDENDLSWMYAPAEKPLFEGSVASSTSFVEIGDENNLAWLYQAPTAAYRGVQQIGFASQSVPLSTQLGQAQDSVKSPSN